MNAPILVCKCSSVEKRNISRWFATQLLDAVLCIHCIVWSNWTSFIFHSSYPFCLFSLYLSLDSLNLSSANPSLNLTPRNPFSLVSPLPSSPLLFSIDLQKHVHRLTSGVKDGRRHRSTSSNRPFYPENWKKSGKEVRRKCPREKSGKEVRKKCPWEKSGKWGGNQMPSVSWDQSCHEQ